MIQSEKQPPFGTYGLSPFRDQLRARSGPWRESVRIIGSVLRQTSVLGLNEPYDVEPANGYRVRLFPSQNVRDKKCFMGLGITGTDHTNIIEQVAAQCPDDMFNFLDIGANSGMYALAAANAAKLANRTLNLVCIEANPTMAQRLAFNLDASGVTDFQIFNCAVSDQAGEIHLSLAKKNLGQATVVDTPDVATTITLPARTLKSILEEAGMPRIDFLKIDIEGHEVPALQPYIESVKHAQKPKNIFAEIAHDPEHKIENLLTANGYRMAQDLIGDALFALKEAA